MPRLKTKRCLDHHLAKSLRSLPNLPFAALLRPEKKSVLRAKKQFLKNGQLPIFDYPQAQAFDSQRYLQELHRVEKEIGASASDPALITLYLKKCSEYRTRAELIAAMSGANDQAVTNLSLQLFGKNFASCKELEQELQNQPIKKLADEAVNRPVSADDFELMVRAALNYYQLDNWRIIRKKISSMRMTHGESGRRPNIILPERRFMSKGKAIRLITHEIEVHAWRMQGALSGPLHLLRRGTAGYLESEEGLAMYCQQHRSGQSWKRSPGFWDVYACALARETNFLTTYQTLEKHQGAKQAWRLCLRVYRGITNTQTPGVGFFRDQIYHDGYKKIKTAIEDNPSIFGKLFSGHFDLADLPLLDQLELPAWRPPDFIAKQIVNKILDNKKS